MQLKKITWALLISLLALFLRTYMAYNGPTEYDEGIYMYSAASLNQAIRQGNWSQILDSTYNTEHPQFNKLVYAVSLFAGRKILPVAPLGLALGPGLEIQSLAFWKYMFGLRMISVILGTATVFLLSLISPLAGLFLAVDTIAIKYTSVVYLEALPAFTSLAALMVSLKSVDAYLNDPGNRRSWIGWLVLSSLLVGMSLASKYTYGLIAISIIIFVIYRLWKHKIPALLGLAGWGILSLAFFFLFDPALWHSPISRLVASVQYHVNYTSSQHVLNSALPFWQPIKWLMLPIPQQHYDPAYFFSFNGNYFVLADSLIFIGALVGLPAFFQKNKPLFIWLAVGMTFLVLWNTKWTQYTMLVIAPFCLSAAYGFGFIRSNLPRLISIIKPKVPEAPPEP